MYISLRVTRIGSGIGIFVLFCAYLMTPIDFDDGVLLTLGLFLGILADTFCHQEKTLPREDTTEVIASIGLQKGYAYRLAHHPSDNGRLAVTETKGNDTINLSIESPFEFCGEGKYRYKEDGTWEKLGD